MTCRDFDRAWNELMDGGANGGGAKLAPGAAQVRPAQGDATALAYEDDSMDAVVLTAVLGEIPDTGAALAEIERVLKPGGRLVVGELFGDPHFTTLGSLRSQGSEAGLSYQEHSGLPLAYFARLEPAQPSG